MKCIQSVMKIPSVDSIEEYGAGSHGRPVQQFYNL